jgi:hypothetical protein
VLSLLTHKKEQGWCDSTHAGLLALVSKGQPVIVVRVGSENSFIPNREQNLEIKNTKLISITMKDGSQRS